MRRARESFQGPRRDRRRVQGDRPGPDRGPQVHGMGSVHALVRRGLAARGMALRRLHDRRIGLPGAFALIFLASTITFIPWALIGYIAADKGASSVSLL